MLNRVIQQNYNFPNLQVIPPIEAQKTLQSI